MDGLMDLLPKVQCLGGGKIFPSTISRLALGYIQPSVHQVQGGSAAESKTGYESDSLPTKVNNVCSHCCCFPYIL